MLKELSESLRKMTVKIHDDTPADDLADDSMAGGEEGGSTDFPTGDDTPTSPGM
jgi:hypothetical protein